MINHDIKLSETEIEEMFDSLGCGICADSVVSTTETFADFEEAAKKYYNEYHAIKVYPVGDCRNDTGYPVMVIEKAQIKKRDVREDMHIIDLGDYRLVGK